MLLKRVEVSATGRSSALGFIGVLRLFCEVPANKNFSIFINHIVSRNLERGPSQRRSNIHSLLFKPTRKNNWRKQARHHELLGSFFPDDPNPVLFDFLDWLGAAMSGKVPLFRMQTQSVMVCCLSGARRSVTHQTGLLPYHSTLSSSLLLRFHFEKDSQIQMN